MEESPRKRSRGATHSGADIPAVREGVHAELAEILQCVLCLSLICEPVTIPCGHSFCRVCLVKALRRSKKKCPTCRSICHVAAETSEESVMLKSLAMHLFPNEYTVRVSEAKAEKTSWESLLPIFYYNEVLVPGSRLELHLFEPRYRHMMQRVVASTRSFAYVPNFRSYCAKIGDVALKAQIHECEFLPDGRALIKANILGRYTITDHYVEEGTQGLHMCRLQPLVDKTDSGRTETLLPQAQALEKCWNDTNAYNREEKKQLETHFGPKPVLEKIEAFSLWMLAVSCLPESSKLELLRTTDTEQRLQVVHSSFVAIQLREEE
jgi:Lon protease-like protein